MAKKNNARSTAAKRTIAAKPKAAIHPKSKQLSKTFDWELIQKRLHELMTGELSHNPIPAPTKEPEPGQQPHLRVQMDRLSKEIGRYELLVNTTRYKTQLLFPLQTMANDNTNHAMVNNDEKRSEDDFLLHQLHYAVAQLAALNYRLEEINFNLEKNI